MPGRPSAKPVFAVPVPNHLAFEAARQVQPTREDLTRIGVACPFVTPALGPARIVASITAAVRGVRSVPLEWFPRLAAATARQRKQWEPIGGGIGIHWDAIDEDISVASLLQPERFMRIAEGTLPWTRARPSRRRASRKSTRTRRAARRLTID